MADWTSSQWEGYASNDDSLHSLFIGHENFQGSYRYRSARVIFTTPSYPIGKISFRSNTSGDAPKYYPAWLGSSDKTNEYTTFAWKITTINDFTCKTNVSNPDGILIYERPKKDAVGYFASASTATVSLAPNTQYALWIFPKDGIVQNRYSGEVFGESPYYLFQVDFTAEKQTYTISYESNGGSSTPATQTKEYNIPIDLAKAISKKDSTITVTTTFNANNGTVSPSSLNSIVTTSYTFTNWKGDDGTLYAAGASYNKNASVVMTAQWSSTTSGASITLPTPVRTGYSFDGWYTAASGGELITSYYPTSNTTLYAHWTIVNYIVSYEPNGGSGVMEPIQVSYGGSHVVKNNSFNAPAPKTSVYKIHLSANYNGGEDSIKQVTNTTLKVFNVWRQNSPSGIDRVPGTTINNIASNLTLYAIWTDGVTQKGRVVLGSISRSSQTTTGYTLNFDSQGGNSINSISSTKTVNYLHEGWSDSKNEYDTVSAYAFDSDTKLSAIWSETYINNPIKLPAGPSRTGYEFLGWATSLNSNSYLQPGQEIVLTENVTYYAIWKALGSVFIYVNNSDKYLAALVFIYDGTNWKQAIPYLHDGTSWKLVAG